MGGKPLADERRESPARSSGSSRRPHPGSGTGRTERSGVLRRSLPGESRRHRPRGRTAPPPSPPGPARPLRRRDPDVLGPAVLQLIRRARPEPGRLRRFDPPTRLLPSAPEAGSRSPESPGSEPRCRCADSPLPPPPGSAPEPGAPSAWRPPSAVGLLFSTPWPTSEPRNRYGSARTPKSASAGAAATPRTAAT